jgi:WD40 repeat protein
MDPELPLLPTSVWVNHVLPFLPDRKSFNNLSCSSKEINDASKQLITAEKITPPWPKTSIFVGSCVNAVAFSSNNGLLASGSEDGLVRIWDRIYGRLVTLEEGVNINCNSVKFSPDGNILASGSDDGVIRLWSLADHSCRVFGGGAEILSTAFSPDGACIATGNVYGETNVWSVNDCSCKRTMRDRRLSLICSVVFSPDGRTLAASGFNDDVGDRSETGTISFWGLTDEANTQRAAAIINDSSPGALCMTAISYSPDGRCLASGSEGGVVKLWNATDRICVAVLQSNGQNIRSVSFSPNGRLLVSGSDDGNIRLWSVERLPLGVPACGIRTRNEIETSGLTGRKSFGFGIRGLDT